MIKIIDFHHFLCTKNASSIETINKHSILLAYIFNMVEMRVLHLINIVYIYINGVCTAHGETRGEIIIGRIFLYLLIF